MKKLVLVAPGGLAAPGGPQARAIDLASRPGGSWIVRLAISRERIADGIKQVFQVKEAVTQATVDRAWAMSRRAGSHDATIKRLQAPSFDPAAVARLGEITAPVLLLWGRDDVVFPLQLAGTFQKAIPSARLVSYEGCGHFPHEELPDRTVTDLQAFLRQ